MKRYLAKNLGLLLLAIGALLLFINLDTALTVCFVGAFLRLIYNSEKYKWFKYIHSQILKRIGPTQFQREAMHTCLWGFYKACADFLLIAIIPFYLIPKLDMSWWIGWIIGVVYVILLKPIFTRLDDVDKGMANDIINQYIEMATGN